MAYCIVTPKRQFDAELPRRLARLGPVNRRTGLGAKHRQRIRHRPPLGQRRTGKQAEGPKPADMAVQQPSRFEPAVNLKAAKAFGITVARSIPLRADEVIQQDRMTAVARSWPPKYRLPAGVFVQYEDRKLKLYK